MTALTLKNVSFGYEKDNLIFSDVNIEIKQGKVISIEGDSGCGKSTLALVMCGVIPKSVHGYFDGDVVLFEENIEEKEIYEIAESISMVFQDPEAQLFSNMVMDEIAFAPENLCYEKEKILACIEKSAGEVNIKELLEFSPNELSGGQQQLVALASILSLDPNIIILDEVTSNIDEDGTKRIKEVVCSLKEKGKTIIIIDHKGDFRDMYDDRFVMKNGKLTKIV